MDGEESIGSRRDSHADPLAAARERVRRREAAKFGDRSVPPTLDDVRAILDFAEGVRDVNDPVLIHCHAGISRSTAAALLCLARWTGPGFERHCVELLFRLRPWAAPHDGLVRFGDRLLDRQGRLMQALADRER